MAESDLPRDRVSPRLPSSDEYSSDEEEPNPKSMLDVRKHGHIPGKYKVDLPESAATSEMDSDKSREDNEDIALTPSSILKSGIFGESVGNNKTQSEKPRPAIAPKPEKPKPFERLEYDQKEDLHNVQGSGDCTSSSDTPPGPLIKPARSINNQSLPDRRSDSEDLCAGTGHSSTEFEDTRNKNDKSDAVDERSKIEMDLEEACRDDRETGPEQMVADDYSIDNGNFDSVSDYSFFTMRDIVCGVSDSVRDISMIDQNAALSDNEQNSGNGAPPAYENTKDCGRLGDAVSTQSEANDQRRNATDQDTTLKLSGEDGNLEKESHSAEVLRNDSENNNNQVSVGMVEDSHDSIDSFKTIESEQSEEAYEDSISGANFEPIADIGSSHDASGNSADYSEDSIHPSTEKIEKVDLEALPEDSIVIVPEGTSEENVWKVGYVSINSSVATDDLTDDSEFDKSKSVTSDSFVVLDDASHSSPNTDDSTGNSECCSDDEKENYDSEGRDETHETEDRNETNDSDKEENVVMESVNLGVGSTASCLKENSAGSLNNYQKSSDEVETFDEAIPPPIMPKSETVLESLKSISTDHTRTDDDDDDDNSKACPPPIMAKSEILLESLKSEASQYEKEEKFQYVDPSPPKLSEHHISDNEPITEPAFASHPFAGGSYPNYAESPRLPIHSVKLPEYSKHFTPEKPHSGYPGYWAQPAIYYGQEGKRYQMPHPIPRYPHGPGQFFYHPSQHYSVYQRTPFMAQSVALPHTAPFNTAVSSSTPTNVLTRSSDHRVHQSMPHLETQNMPRFEDKEFPERPKPKPRKRQSVNMTPKKMDDPHHESRKFDNPKHVEYQQSESHKLDMPKVVERKESPKLDMPKIVEWKESPKLHKPKNAERNESPKLDKPKNAEQKESAKLDKPKNVERKKSPSLDRPKNVERKESPRLDRPKNVERKESPSLDKPKNGEQRESSKLGNMKKMDKQHKKIHMSEKTPQKAKRIPAPAPRFMLEKKEFCVLFKGLARDTQVGSITNSIEIATGIEAETDNVVFDDSQENAWVILHEKPDVNKLSERIKKKGINMKYPVVSEVSPDSIPSRREKKTARTSQSFQAPPIPKNESCDVGQVLIYIKDLNPDTNEENLRNFVETATKGTIDPIIYNYTRTCALVSIQGDPTPDLNKLRTKIEDHGLEGYHPKLYKMPLPNSIAVSSETKIRNREIIEYYFESPRSNGGEIIKVYDAADGTCIVVEYKEHEVVKKVCLKKDHRVDDQLLRVSPYYKCEHGAIWDAKTHSVTFPEPISLQPEKLVLQFLQKSCCSELLILLESNYCKVDFESDTIRMQCFITPKIEGFKNLADKWQETVEDLFHKYVDEKIKREILKSDENVWIDLMAEKLDDNPHVIVSPCATSYTIAIVGFESGVGESFRILQTKHEEIKRRLNRRTDIYRETKLKSELLRKLRVFEEAVEENSDLAVEFKEGMVIVEGQPEDLQTVRQRVDKIIDDFVSDTFPHKLSKYCVDFIESRLKAKISQLFEEEQIPLAWSIDDDEFEFCIYNKGMSGTIQDNNKVKALFERNIKEKESFCDRLNTHIFESPDWTSFSVEIIEKYEESVQMEVEDNKVMVFGCQKEVAVIHEEVEDFIKNHSVYEIRIDFSPIEMKFILKHKERYLSDLESLYQHHKVQLERDGNADRVTVRATKEGLKCIEFEIERYKKSMVSEQYKIEKVAVRDVMRDEYEQGTIDKIERETRCIIQLPYEDIADDNTDSFTEDPVFDAVGNSQTEKPVAASRKPPNEFTTKNGTVIYLVKGELHKENGDVIVVTTSPDLNLSSGKACKSLLQAAGQEMQDECKQKYPNEISYGDIAVVKGHGLECNRVYLTTLPSYGKHDEPQEVLRKVMKTALEMASKHKKSSIMFSAMGTGQLKYPRDIVAKVMFDSVIEFDQNNPKSTLKVIKFVLYPKDYSTIGVFKDEIEMRISFKGDRPIPELQIGCIKLEVVTENISDQKVDAIFCTTSTNMDLTHGACKALLDKGGKTLQQECQSEYQNKLDECQIVGISAGNLSCKTLFLTVLGRHNADSIEKLKKVIKALLELCEAQKLASVAMPALGTGNLKYPREEVCRAMFDSVINFSKDNPLTNIKNVRFVMHAKDYEVRKTFQNYALLAKTWGKRKERGQKPKNEPATNSQGSSSQPSPVAQPTNQRYNAIKDRFTIGSINLQVTVGNLLTMKTDVIVNSVGDDFDLIGGVSQALIKQCPSLVQECSDDTIKKKLKKNNVVKTQCKELSAQYVFHVRYAEKVKDWGSRMKLCLERANKHKFRSIAFPVLGTGSAFNSVSSEEIAGCLFDVIDQFEKGPGPVCLQEIHLVVFTGQPAMYDLLIKKLHAKVQEAVNAQSESYARKFWNRVKAPFKSSSPHDVEKHKQETSSMTVVIHSDSKDKITQCKIDLEAKIEASYVKHTVADYKELLKKLTPEERKQLDVARLVNMNIDDKAGIITIEGPIKEVNRTASEIQMQLLKIQRIRNETEIAEDLYKIVQWQYEEVTQDGSFELKLYDKDLNFKIEEAYMGNKPDLKFISDDVTYVIDFKRLVEYPETDDKDLVRVVRKDILKEASGALPADWTKMDDGQNLKIVALDKKDPKYLEIEKKFVDEVKAGVYANRVKFSFDVNALKVEKIERVQNKTLYQQYQAKKKQMKLQKPNLSSKMPLERQLWHGMKPEVIPSIQNHGFNRSYSGSANGEPWYGEGVYFAGDASYSCRGWLTGAKSGARSHIFLVDVLTGQFCTGTKGMRYLPPIDPKNPTVQYDSAVDNPQNPYEFVIFNDTQAYPTYLVTFTS